MKKRADTDLISLWFLMELIGAFLVGYMAVNLSLAYTQWTIYEKLNIAKDLAMQINTLSSVQGNAYIVNNNVNGYSISVADNKIEVFQDEFDQSRGVYYFVKKANSNLNIKLEKPKQIILAKIGDEISISEKIPNLS